MSSQCRFWRQLDELSGAEQSEELEKGYRSPEVRRSDTPLKFLLGQHGRRVIRTHVNPSSIMTTTVRCGGLQMGSPSQTDPKVLCYRVAEPSIRTVRPGIALKILSTGDTH